MATQNPQSNNIFEGDMEVPEVIKSQGTTAEHAILLQRLLGGPVLSNQLDLQEERSNLANAIQSNIFNIIGTVRLSLTREQLRDAIDQQLTKAVVSFTQQDLESDNKKREAVARAVFAALPQDIAQTLVMRNITSIRDVNVRDEVLQIYTRLQTETENKTGAAMAAMMALENANIRTAIAIPDSATATRNLRNFENQKSVYTALNELRKTPKISITDYPGAPVAINQQYLQRELTLLKSDLRHVKGGIGTIDSDYGVSGNELPTGAPAYTMQDSNGKTIRDTKAQEVAEKKLQEKIKEVEAETVKYQKMQNAFRNLLSVATKNSMPAISNEVAKYLDVRRGGLLPTTDSSFDAEFIADDILNIALNGTPPLRDIDDIEGDIKTSKTAIDTSKKGGLQGDELQKKIFAEYAKSRNRGMVDQDAQKVGSYLYARTLLDKELTGMMEDVSNERYESHGTEGGLFTQPPIYRAVASIAQTLGAQKLPKSEYAWPNDYTQLATAYFALRALHDGEGPDYLNAKDSGYAKKQLAKISEKLLTNPAFIRMIENDYYQALSPEEKAKLTKSKKAIIADMGRQYLQGPAPTLIHQKVEHILHHLDENLDWDNRKSWELQKGLATGVVSTIKATGRGIWKVMGWVNDNKHEIAKATLLTVVGGPIGLGVYYFTKKSKDAQGGGHDDHGHGGATHH